MRWLHTIALVTLLSATLPEFEEVEVLQATEAETITVILRGTPQTIRYIGVAPPPPWDPIEGRDEWAEAAGGLARDTLVGQTAYLEYGKEQYDAQGQRWAYVWTEEPLSMDADAIRKNMFNARLILSGYARAKAEHPNTRYAHLFAEYQKEAQEASRGMWSQMALELAPHAN